MIERLTANTPPVTLSSAQLFLVYTGPHGKHPVALGGGAADLALLPVRLPRVLLRGGRPVAARLRDAARLLPDPGAALRGARSRAADEPARGSDLGEQEPLLARGRPAGGARLGPARGLRDRPPRPGRRA